MKFSMMLSAVALIFAAGSFGFVSSAMANDDARDVITGIIGEAVAAEAEGEGDDAEEDPRCEAWENKCDAGDQAACNMADASCGDDEEEGGTED
jgi:hypothetical protein